MLKMAKSRGGAMGTMLVVICLIVILSAAGAIYVSQSPQQRLRVLQWRLDGMSNADYSNEIASLVAAERFEEADKLAAFVAANPEMPGQEKVAGLREEIRRGAAQSKSPIQRGYEILSGFLSGGGESMEERLGGLFSNILIQNKALSEADLSRAEADETEELVQALERANLGLAARWFPGVIRTLARSRLLTPDFEAFLMENAAASEREGRATPALSTAADNTRKMVTTLGLQETVGLFPSIRNGGDMEQILSWARILPDETYIVSSMGGVKLLSRIPQTEEGRSLLSAIARKGKPAIGKADFWLQSGN